MARDPGTGAKKPKPSKPKKPFLDAIGHPQIRPGDKHGVINAPKNNALARAQENVARRQLDPEVVSRQRLLRAHGYGVIVDGVWGPRSANAWAEYQQRLRSPAPQPMAPKPPTVQSARKETIGLHREAIQQARERAQAGVLLLKAQRQLAKMHAAPMHSPEIRQRIGQLQQQILSRPGQAPSVTAPAALGIAREVQRVVDVAVRARAKAPEKMTTEELVATTVDPITGRLDPSSPGEVRRVQRWLRSRGHKIAVDGVYSRETNAALREAMKQFELEKQAAQARVLENRFYRTGVVVPGQPLGPLAEAPKPGELLAILQGRGPAFTSAAIWAEMTRRLELADPSYLLFVQKQLGEIERNLRGTFAQARFIKRTLDTRFLDITSALPSVMGTQAAAEWSDQLTQLVSATSGEDLQRRLRKLSADAEAKVAAHAKTKMGDKSVWGKVWGATTEVAGALGQPAHWFTSGVEEIVAGIADAAEYPRDAFRLQRSKEEQQRAEERVKQFQAEHPWIQLGLEFVADPLWLVDPVVIAGKAAKLGSLGAMRLERIGYTLEEGGRLQRLAAPVLMAPKDTIQRFELLARSAREQGLGGKLLTQKRAMVAQVQHRVRTLRRHDFRKTVGATDALWGGSKPAEGAVRFSLDESGPIFRAAVDRVAPIAKDLDLAGAVIFTDADRSIDSVIGGQIRARATSTGVANIVQDFAINEGHYSYVARKYGSEELVAILRKHHFHGGVFDGIASGRIVDREGSGIYDELMDRYKEVLDEWGSIPEEVAGHNDDVAREFARESYREAMRRGVGHAVGGGDLWVEEQIGWLIEKLQDDIGDTLAQVQSRVEELHDARVALAKATEGAEAVPPLYDEAGKFVGRGGDATATALSVASEAFGKTVSVRNPAFRRGHTADEMMTLRWSEIGRRERQLRSLAARKTAEGLPTNLDEDIQKVYDDVTAAWKTGDDGLFYDSREFIDVDAMHVRGLTAAFRTGALDALGDLDGVLRQALSSANVGGAATGFEEKLDTLAFFLTRSRSLTKWDLELTKGQSDFLVRDLEMDVDLWQQGKEFQRALENHTKNLDLAEAYAKPKEMLRQWAVWEALQHAQTKELQVVYKALSGWLDTWLLLTLPLRPGFAVRNIIDNTSKSLVSGAIDPRYYFPQGLIGHSIFDLGIQQIRYILSFGGRYQGNRALHYFDRLLDTFWNHDSEVIKRIFAAHQIDVPVKAIKAMQDDALAATADTRIKGWRDKVWHLMAAVPENYAKKVVYRSEYARQIRNGASEIDAFQAALNKVEFTLFDYSKGSVLEDNLRVIFPFLQYWRRTATLWVTRALEKPALPMAVQRYEDYRDQAHEDLPSWMRRYVKLDPVTNVLARVPALSWLLPGLQDGLQTDPMNLLSFSVLYRSFKSENPDLPPDKAGWRFISGFADAINDWGVSFNPLVRKPLEVAGVFNFRAWQSVFPETSLFQALSIPALGERFGGAGLNLEAWLEDKVLTLIGEGPLVQERIASGFNQWVQLEMAAQAERGEPVSRDAATKKIQDYYVVQTVLSFFGGVYARRRDAADVYLYKIAEQLHTDADAFESLSKKDQHAYRIFAKRKIDYLAFDRYLEALPTLEAYYNLHGDWEAMQEFKQRHPEIVPYLKTGKLYGDSFVRDAPLLVDNEAAFRLFDLVNKIDVAHDVRQLAEAAIVTPELSAFWARNDTPKQIRDKMVKGQFFQVMSRMNEAYFAIPEKDFEARDGFLKANPILAHWWNLNNDRGDDLKTVMNSTNATLRDHYFRLLDAKDFDGARAFLHRFPFIFEFTSAEADVDEDGNWIRSRRIGGKRGSRGMTEHGRDYLKAKSALAIFFALIKAGNKQDAYAWLDGDSPEAKLVRWYFDKYAHKRGPSQHALDYLAVKEHLDYYFKLKERDPDAARAWLRSGAPEAEAVRAYFKKYGHLSKAARKWKDPIHSDDPEINRRLKFWQTYWTLPPDSRPAFIAQAADRDGIFVYGAFGQEQRDRELNDYLREAQKHHLTPKAALYLRIKPLLDVYFELDKPADKDLFLRANPDVQQYLDSYTDGPSTGDKDLDALLERYFKLPRRSEERSALIKANPSLQDYFDNHSSPADAAMRDLLEVYFEIPPGKKRKDFTAQHPEIHAYFDKRRQERDVEIAQAMAFDLADPRLRGLVDEAWVNTGESAERVFRSLRRGVAENRFGDAIEVRRL